MDSNITVIIIAIIAIIMAIIQLIIAVVGSGFVYKKITKKFGLTGGTGGGPAPNGLVSSSTYTYVMVNFDKILTITPQDRDLYHYTSIDKLTSSIINNTQGYTPSSNLITLDYWKNTPVNSQASYIFSNQSYNYNTYYDYFTVSINSSYTINNNYSKSGAKSNTAYINIPIGYSAKLDIYNNNINVSVKRDVYFATGNDGYYHSPNVFIDISKQYVNSKNSTSCGSGNIQNILDIVPNSFVSFFASSNNSGHNNLYISADNEIVTGQGFDFNFYPYTTSSNAGFDSVVVAYNKTFGSLSSCSKVSDTNDGNVNVILITDNSITGLNT